MLWHTIVCELLEGESIISNNKEMMLVDQMGPFRPESSYFAAFGIATIH